MSTYPKDALVFLTRRAYETGEIRIALNTAEPCAIQDSGWQLFQGKETGLELADPGNSLLVSLSRALELEPRLNALFAMPRPTTRCAYCMDTATGTFLKMDYPENPPTA